MSNNFISTTSLKLAYSETQISENITNILDFRQMIALFITSIFAC